MVEPFAVVPEDLHSDAQVWRTWQERLTTIADAVPVLGRGLIPTDFSLLPGAQEVAAAYAPIASDLDTELRAGSSTFEGIANKLTTVARQYEAAEQDNLSTIKSTGLK